MELKKRVLNLRFNGGEYIVNFPTVKQLKDECKIKGDETGLDMTVRFLGLLGLPSEVVDEMEPSHLEEVLAHLTDQKKR